MTTRVVLPANMPVRLNVSPGSYYIEFRKTTDENTLSIIRYRINWEHTSSTTPPTTQQWSSSGQESSSIKVSLKTGKNLWVQNDYESSVVVMVSLL